MNPKLNTLLVTLYVTLTDRILPDLGVTDLRRPGRKKQLSDAELICLVVAQHLLQFDSETRWNRYCHAHLRSVFPNVPGQSGYNKHVRAAGTLFSAVMAALARDVESWHELVRLVDSTPVPTGASRETVKRSDLAGHSGYGYCASHSRFFWGLRLYLLTTPDGMPVIWGLANPKLGEREVTQALLARDHHLVAHGQVIVGDKGFAGRDFAAFITHDLGAHFVRPDKQNQPAKHGNLGGIRQWIESVFDTLKGQLGLEDHGGRTVEGVFARVASKLLSMAAAIWHNWHTGAPRKRSLVAYDH